MKRDVIKRVLIYIAKKCLGTIATINEIKNRVDFFLKCIGLLIIKKEEGEKKADR